MLTNSPHLCYDNSKRDKGAEMHFAHDVLSETVPQRAAAHHKASARLFSDAEKALAVSRLSVVDNPHLAVSGDPHDYYSIAPYSHPNPATSDGLPYIHRDGIFNPDFEECDRRRMDRLCSSVRTLTLAYLASHVEAYRAHAVKLLRCFFLDEETRMNPHMEYAQAVRGACDGRGIGIIDIRRSYRMLDMVSCLSDPILEEELRVYFSRFLIWLRGSKKGHDELIRKNNHGTWYDVTCAGMALFVGEQGLAREILSTFAERRLAVQVAEDGALPLELKRTRPFLYSTIALNGAFIAARMAKRLDIPLFQDARLRAAFRFMIPFYASPDSFPYRQIKDGVYETETWEMAYELLRIGGEEYGMPVCGEIAASVLQKIPESDIVLLV